MKRKNLRTRVMVGGVAAVLAGTASATVALAGPEALPLRPLATAQPAPDGYQHVLVRVPAGTPFVPTAVNGTDKAGAPGALSGVDLAALARYRGRLDRLDRGQNGRVLAILTDGSSVDVTAGAASAPAVAHTAEKAIPAPLLALAIDPGVVDVSPVDPTTWKVTGNLPADRVSAVTGLPTHSDVLMQVTADDTYRSLLWALQNNGGTVGGYPAVADADVDGVEANRRGTGTGVVVAVVDSGVQAGHPDLPPLWRNPNEICGNGVDDDRNGYVDDCNGWDFVHNDNTTYDAGDNNDHGTHVAGTIAAVPNNGTGVAGLAPGATIMSVKVTANGSMWMSDVAKAIRYAADNGAKVINASLGTSPGTPREGVRDMGNAIAYAGTKGVLVVASAGNNGANTDVQPTWPADLPLDNIVSVGASTAAEQPAGFSNYGATSVDLFAPGHYIVSTVDRGGYAAMQGTSMAAPHVTAAAALVASADPALSPAEVRQRLMDTVDPSDAYRGKSVTGGRLNADRALAASGVTLNAAAFHDFAADTPHTGTLTIKAASGTVPAGSAVAPRATLLTNIDGTTYAVLDQPVTINGDDVGTDANGQVLLGSAVDGAEPTLTGDGIRVAVGMTLPPGDYAIVVDLVSAADNAYTYGRSNAIFFVVPGAGGPAPAPAPPAPAPPAPAPPAPTAGSTPPGSGVPPTGNRPPTAGGARPGTTAPATRPTTGTVPSPATPPNSGTVPAPSPATPPNSGTVPAPSPAPWIGTAPIPGTAPRPGTLPRPGGQPVPPAQPPAAGSRPTPTNPSGPPAPAPVTANGITITSVTPANGPAGGGTAVMITGAGFPTYPVVYIGGVGAYVASRTSVSLTVITPAGAAGSAVPVMVGDPTGRSVTMPNGFRYDPAAPGNGGTPPGSTVPPAPAPGAPAPGATPPAAPRPAALRRGRPRPHRQVRREPPRATPCGSVRQPPVTGCASRRCSTT